MISTYKLPFSFDAQLLQSDLQRIMPEEWVAHFNQGYYKGEWSGVALRSAGGVASHINPEPLSQEPFRETPVLDQCPNVRALLETLKCPLRSVRFLKLAAGSRIKEHRDNDLGFESGQVRLHIPVTTNPRVKFFLDAHRILLNEGECWYLNFSLPHWIENGGDSDRVHLVIDCVLDEWLREFFPSDLFPPGDSEQSAGQPGEVFASSPAELERFRKAVANDLSLQQRLRETADWDSFIRLVVAVGRDAGYRFTAADAEGALRTAQQSWLLRWID